MSEKHPDWLRYFAGWLVIGGVYYRGCIIGEIVSAHLPPGPRPEPLGLLGSAPLFTTTSFPFHQGSDTHSAFPTNLSSLPFPVLHLSRQSSSEHSTFTQDINTMLALPTTSTRQTLHHLSLSLPRVLPIIATRRLLTTTSHIPRPTPRSTSITTSPRPTPFTIKNPTQHKRHLHLAPPFLLDTYTPRYLLLSETDAAKKRSQAYAHLAKCNLCPRKCGVNRFEKTGWCLIGEKAKVNVVAPHFGEGEYFLLYFLGTFLHCFCEVLGKGLHDAGWG